MIDHTSFSVADFAVPTTFYDVDISALGMRRAKQIPEGAGTYGLKYGVVCQGFWIDNFYPHLIYQQTAFVANSRASMDVFYSAR